MWKSVTMTAHTAVYARAMMLRIDHHAPDYLSMWLKLEPELLSEHWTPQFRAGKRYRFGISAKFKARNNGKVLGFVYKDNIVHMTVDGVTHTFGARQPKAALRFVRSVRARP
jgi:hypothetical protein